MTTPQPDAAPKFIFLQDYEAGHEATWCSDKINDDDVQYVRADELTILRAANLAAQKLIDEGREALAKDAARYRWLRHNSGYTIRCELFGEVGMREHDDNQLDELIDAAMQEKACPSA